MKSLLSNTLNTFTFILLYMLIFSPGCRLPKEISEMKFEMPDLQMAKSGSYTGIQDSGIVSAEVQVMINKGEIREVIIIRHDTGMGKKAETITDSIIKYQSVELDAISGATASSKTILKATEKAIIKSIQNN